MQGSGQPDAAAKTTGEVQPIVTNRVLGPVARFLPGFAVVSHVGRRSGRSYRTPVNLFRRGDGYVIALTYGADSQWVRNVLAAGAVDVETRGRRVHLVDPEVVRDPARTLVPAPVRVVLGLANVDEFMLLNEIAQDADRLRPALTRRGPRTYLLGARGTEPQRAKPRGCKGSPL